MKDTSLLQMALGLTPPWHVTRSDFDPDAHRLDIHLDFPPAAASPVRSAPPPTARRTTPRPQPGAI